MNDLISRSALLEELKVQRGIECIKGVATINMAIDKGIEIAIRSIVSAPAVDAVPVKYGRQEKSKENDEWYGKYFTCLGCHTRTMAVDPHFNEIEPTYCPNCGAKMDLEVNLCLR